MSKYNTQLTGREHGVSRDAHPCFVCTFTSMDLSTWIAQFDKDKLLQSTASALPPPLRGALLCRVSNVTLPLDLVLKKASRTAPMADTDTRHSVVYLPQPPVEVVEPHIPPVDLAPPVPAVDWERPSEPHTRERVGRHQAESQEEQPRRRSRRPDYKRGPCTFAEPAEGWESHCQSAPPVPGGTDPHETPCGDSPSSVLFP